MQISEQDLAVQDEDRFDRFRLISWWDQKRLASARVVVIGAGALGNEITKNLALLGIGHVLIADMDRIENSNLSRSVLYRECDNGQYKAQIAARAAAEVYPGIKAEAFTGNIVYDLGLGAFRWADVVIAGLDNREARLHVNRACWKLNKPWIDGAIEAIDGTARVFVPDGPCYECTMSETDWKLLRARRSCNLLSRSQMEQGKTPTTPTISSIIAGIQCQEAVKLLHGMESFGGKGIVFNGLSADSYQIEYQRRDDCYSHDTLGQVVPLGAGAETITLGAILDKARQILGSDAQIEFGRDMLEKLMCPTCRREEAMFVSLGKVRSEQAICPHCPGVRREPVTFYKLRGDEAILERTPAQIGLPAFDIIIARKGSRAIGLELDADAPQVLKSLWAEDGLEFE